MTIQEVDYGDEGMHGSALSFDPDNSLAFRLGQLTLLLRVATDTQCSINTLDRLTYFDFLAANPYLMLEGDDRRKTEDRRRVRLASFSSRQLSYNSIGQRFVSRRERMKHSYGLVEVRGGYGLSEPGLDFSDNLTTIYAYSYRESAGIVLRRFGKSSEAALASAMREWLGESWLLLDLLRDIVNPEPGILVAKGQESE